MLCVILAAWWGWVPAHSFEEAGCQTERNAAWISVDWTSQPVAPDAVSALAKQAGDNGLAYLYPYVSYVKLDGTFSESYEYAAEFARAFRRHNGETQLLAWVGVPVVNERRVGIKGWVNLADPAERQQIVLFVAQLLSQSTLDGIHLNVETVQDGDAGYLLLLEEVKAAVEDEYLVSIASTYWLPKMVNDLPVLDGYRWSGDYYRAIAGSVDQIVTMTYDSLMPHPALYRLWMRGQVRAISRAVAAEDVELLIGLSVSEEETMTHRPRAENMASGLAGVCAGLSDSNTNPRVDGVAVYASWEATPEEWQLWQRWLHAAGQSE